MKSTEEKIKVMQAYLEGKIIQIRTYSDDDSWTDCPNNISWNWEEFDYCIKPANEEYREFNQKEMANLVGEVLRSKSSKTTALVTHYSFDEGTGIGKCLLAKIGCKTAKELLNDYVFRDTGTVCGVKADE